jgi:hypothetical protein
MWLLGERKSSTMYMLKSNAKALVCIEPRDDLQWSYGKTLEVNEHFT